MVITLTSEYIEIVKKVIAVAYKRRVSYISSEGGSLGEVPQTPEHIQSEKDLIELLESLSFDEIKFIQTIMYLGRDTTEDELENYSGLELFDMTYKFLNWDTQKIETDKIIEKSPLDEYLQKGLEYLIR